MKEFRYKARKRLKDSTRQEYEILIHSAKLTPRQEEIINLHILRDYPICKIALILSCSESLIRKSLSIVYEKVAFL